MTKIKWGIIGCGDVTEVKSGPAFNNIDDSSLVAVMRRDANKAEDYAKRHGVPKWYDDASRLINDPEVNAIYIATPPSSHEQYTLEAISAGKPVYVEKPMSLDQSGCERMVAAASSGGVKLSVAHYRRALPLYQKIKELLDEHAIGDIRFVTVQLVKAAPPAAAAVRTDNWRVNPAVSGGGLFHDLSPHQLDLMLYYFGSVLQASGYSANQGRYNTADDLVTGSIVFNSGIVFQGLWSFSTSIDAAIDSCEIAGSEAKMRFSFFGNEIRVTKKGVDSFYKIDHPKHVQQPMIAKVVDYFLDRGPNPCSGEEAIEVMKIMDAFTRK